MNRFQELRRKMGLTQEEFRQKFNECFGRNYTAAAISQIENGKRYPAIPALMDFADFYNVSVDYLIEHDNYQVGIVITEEQSEFLSKIESLDDESKKDCLQYIEFLKQKQAKKVLKQSSTLRTTSRRLRKINSSW